MIQNRYIEKKKEVQMILNAREKGEWVHCLPFHKNELFGFFNYFYYPLEWKDYRVTHLVMDSKMYEVVERVCDECGQRAQKKDYNPYLDKNTDPLMDAIGFKGVLMGAEIYVSDKCEMKGELSSVTSASIGYRDFRCSSRPIYLHPFDFVEINEINEDKNKKIIKKLEEIIEIMKDN